MLPYLLKKKLAFAVWSLPGETGWQGMAQYDAEPLRISVGKLGKQTGFAISAFDNRGEIRLIRPDMVFSHQSFDLRGEYREYEDFELPRPPCPPAVVTKKEYLTACAGLIAGIKAGKAEKVILSRVMAVDFNAGKIIGFYESLLQNYPEAMVFLYAAGEEVWIGATPEVLLEYVDGTFKTVALAGSRPAGTGPGWLSKEIQEQKYVADYVREALDRLKITCRESETITVKAGPVEHLKTEFTGIAAKEEIPALIEKLHPTPAVCGIPKDSARVLIAASEMHDRRDYTGFMGPVFPDEGRIGLYVNLRSAMVTHEKLYFFLGGGITAGSDPQKEWEETALKAGTLLNCYKKC